MALRPSLRCTHVPLAPSIQIAGEPLTCSVLLPKFILTASLAKSSYLPYSVLSFPESTWFHLSHPLSLLVLEPDSLSMWPPPAKKTHEAPCGSSLATAGSSLCALSPFPWPSPHPPDSFPWSVAPGLSPERLNLPELV